MVLLLVWIVLALLILTLFYYFLVAWKVPDPPRSIAMLILSLFAIVIIARRFGLL